MVNNEQCGGSGANRLGWANLRTVMPDEEATRSTTDFIRQRLNLRNAEVGGTEDQSSPPTKKKHNTESERGGTPAVKRLNRQRTDIEQGRTPQSKA